MSGPPRPAEVCRLLLGALAASEGRRRRRKRDTTPDALGLARKHQLLEAAVREDPDPAAFEAWLLDQAAPDGGSGAARAMGRAILEEWRLATASPEFWRWLQQGARSDDAERQAGGS